MKTLHNKNSQDIRLRMKDYCWGIIVNVSVENTVCLCYCMTCYRDSWWRCYGLDLIYASVSKVTVYRLLFSCNLLQSYIICSAILTKLSTMNPELSLKHKFCLNTSRLTEIEHVTNIKTHNYVAVLIAWKFHIFHSYFSHQTMATLRQTMKQHLKSLFAAHLICYLEM